MVIRRHSTCKPQRVSARAVVAMDGQSMVEFMLILPAFLLCLLAILFFSLAIHTVIDYNSAVSTSVRQATLINYATGNNPSYDDAIGQILRASLRSDNPDRANYYDVQLVQSRALTDAGAGSLYENFYTYEMSTHSFDVNPYDYISQNSSALASQYGAVPTPCQYFYNTHEDPSSGDVFLDSSDQVNLTTDAEAQAHVPSDADLLSGCGRDAPPGTNDPCLNNGEAAGVTTHLCYYYPSDRTDTVSTSATDTGQVLPDELDVAVNYTWKPMGSGPLGFGFTITAHARARVEPVVSTSSS